MTGRLWYQRWPQGKICKIELERVVLALFVGWLAGEDGQLSEVHVESGSPTTFFIFHYTSRERYGQNYHQWYRGVHTSIFHI